MENFILCETNVSVVRKILHIKVLMLEKTKQNRLMLVSNCSIWAKNMLKFIKHQDVSELLKKLEIGTPLINIPLIDILF